MHLKTKIIPCTSDKKIMKQKQVMLALRNEIIDHETKYYSDNFNTLNVPTPDLIDNNSLTKLLYLPQRVNLCFLNLTIFRSLIVKSKDTKSFTLFFTF